jgi:uncharacterized protein (DUF4415 family)
MTASRKSTGSDFAKIDGYLNTAADYEDLSEISDEEFARAVPHQGGKPLRGRPPLGDSPKTSITIRLDQDVVAYYRGMGAGWQSKINALLRKTMKA